MRIHLLNEQGVSLRWTGVTQSLGAICASLGLRETDAVWQRIPFTEAEPRISRGGLLFCSSKKMGLDVQQGERPSFCPRY